MMAATIPDPAVGLVVTAMVYASMVYARVFLSYVLLMETLLWLWCQMVAGLTS